MNWIDRDFGDDDTKRLWQKLKEKIPDFFADLTDIRPSLLHGDLWSGNAGQSDGKAGKLDRKNCQS